MIGATTSEETADVESLWHIPITLVGSHCFQRAMPSFAFVAGAAEIDRNILEMGTWLLSIALRLTSKLNFKLLQSFNVYWVQSESNAFKCPMLNEDIQNPLSWTVLQLQGTISSACFSPFGTIKSVLVEYSLGSMDVVKSEEENRKEWDAVKVCLIVLAGDGTLGVHLLASQRKFGSNSIPIYSPRKHHHSTTWYLNVTNILHQIISLRKTRRQISHTTWYRSSATPLTRVLSLTSAPSPSAYRLLTFKSLPCATPISNPLFLSWSRAWISTLFLLLAPCPLLILHAPIPANPSPLPSPSKHSISNSKVHQKSSYPGSTISHLQMQLYLSSPAPTRFPHHNGRPE